MSSFAKYLPSKGFLAVSMAVFLSMALVGGVFALSRSEVANDNSLRIPTIASVEELSSGIENELTNKDTDSDGLKDWEESLWGSNFNNKDTDGDGTNDGDEVEANRNPTISGPNDINTEKSTSSEGSKPEELTTTDKISRIAFARYMQIKQGGGEVDDKFEKQLVAEVLNTQNTSLKQARLYTEGDLIIVEGNKNNLTEFGNKMGEIVKSANWGVDELEILKTALDKEDPKSLDKINVAINGYKGVIDNALLVPTPKNAVREHLLFLNAISKMVNSLEGSKVAFKDPALALAYFGKYPEHVTNLHRAFIDIQGLFSRNNISYSENDTGLIYARFADIVNYVATKQK